MDVSAKSPTSIVQLISLTLGLVGTGGCLRDPITILDGGTDSTADASSESGAESGTESGTDSSTDPTTDPTDTYDSGLPPCPEPTVIPIGVMDWPVTPEIYDTMRTSTEPYATQAWDLIDDAERCMLACAYATGHVDALIPYDYFTLQLVECQLSIPSMDADGVLTCSGDYIEEQFCGGGRMPLEWVPAGGGGQGLAGCLDAMATMEAVSITAFEELADQLERLGAPASLVERCCWAAGDEARHLALLEQLGGRGPAQLPAPASAETALFTIALHNAVEGCVNETWAALLARHQSEHAAEPSTRRAFAEIANDEARHAQLAWDLHDWLCGLLSPDEVARVEAARARALGELEHVTVQQAFALSASTRRVLGLPDPRRARALARVYGAQLAAVA